MPRDGPGTSLIRVNAASISERSTMFFFFSNRLGCLGSLLVSAVVTVVLVIALAR